MIFDIGIYQLDIDIEQTANYYWDSEGILCDCDLCTNYAKAIPLLPAPVQQFFRQFGIDPGKPTELSINYGSDKNTVNYDGFYYLCGTILKGTNPWVQIADRRFQLDEPYRIDLGNQCCVYFEKPKAVLGEDFPRPVIQMNIDFTLPWVLDKPNPYLYTTQ